MWEWFRHVLYIILSRRINSLVWLLFAFSESHVMNFMTRKSNISTVLIPIPTLYNFKLAFSWVSVFCYCCFHIIYFFLPFESSGNQLLDGTDGHRLLQEKHDQDDFFLIFGLPNIFILISSNWDWDRFWYDLMTVRFT